MSVVAPLRPYQVTDAKTFTNWVQSTYGVPHPTVADIKTLNGKARKLFEENPGTDWTTLVQVAQWCASKKRRMARVWNYVDQFRFAWAAHAVEIASPDSLDERVMAALAMEQDPAWRARLRRAVGSHREEVLSEWELHRQ